MSFQVFEERSQQLSGKFYSSIFVPFSAFLQFWLEQSSPRESHAVLVQATWRTEMLDNRL